MSMLLTGPAVTAGEISAAAAAKLKPSEVLDITEAAELSDALAVPDRYRRRRLVRWAGFSAVSPTPELADTLRGLKAQGGVWLVAHSTGQPDEVWSQVFAAVVNCRLSAAEARTWTQTRLSGAPVTAALALLESVDGDIDLAGEAMDLLRLVATKPTPGDVGEVIVPLPEPRFIAELLALHRREAMAHAPKLSDPGRVLAELQAALLALWAMAEARPPIQRRPARDVAAQLGLDASVVATLAPLVRLYSRQKVRGRLEALAIADAQLRRCGGDFRGVAEVLVSCW